LSTVLVTGGAGRIGTYLRRGLPALGWRLRLLDRVPPAPGGDAETVTADVTDRAAVAAAVSGVDAVVHLAGVMRADAAFDEILTANIDGTFAVLDQARQAGVGRFVYASTNHANGFAPRSSGFRSPGSAGSPGGDRPDSYYGVSKLFGEALCRLYVDRYGMQIACLRIGSCFDVPRNPRMLGTWLSPGDSVRLVHACLTYPELEYAVVYGTSANSRNWWDISPARALGYEPRDNAERFAADILAPFGGHDPTTQEDPQGGDSAWRA
jgi:uronate dehydrogenase